MPDRAEWTPWKGRWQVCFVPAGLHWITRLLRRNRSPFQHCFLMQPVPGGHYWLVAEWTFRCYGVTIVDSKAAALLHRLVTMRGCMCEFEGSATPPVFGLLWAFRPKTCVTFIRSVMGLPPRSFVYTCEQLWYELQGLGAIVIVDPPERELAHGHFRWRGRQQRV